MRGGSVVLILPLTYAGIAILTLVYQVRNRLPREFPRGAGVTILRALLWLVFWAILFWRSF